MKYRKDKIAINSFVIDPRCPACEHASLSARDDPDGNYCHVLCEMCHFGWAERGHYDEEKRKWILDSIEIKGGGPD